MSFERGDVKKSHARRKFKNGRRMLLLFRGGIIWRENKTKEKRKYK